MLSVVRLVHCCDVSTGIYNQFTRDCFNLEPLNVARNTPLIRNVWLISEKDSPAIHQILCIHGLGNCVETTGLIVRLYERHKKTFANLVGRLSGNSTSIFI